MCRPLVISVQKDHKSVATIYFSNEGYTLPALKRAWSFFEVVSVFENAGFDFQLACIRYAEQSGGGIYFGDEDKERNYIQSVFPLEEFKKGNYSSENGVVAISASGQRKLNRLSNQKIVIDLDRNVVRNNLFNFYHDLEELNYQSKDVFAPVSMDEVNDELCCVNHDYIDLSDLEDVIDVLRESTARAYLVDYGFVTLLETEEQTAENEKKKEEVAKAFKEKLIQKIIGNDYTFDATEYLNLAGVKKVTFKILEYHEGLQKYVIANSNRCFENEERIRIFLDAWLADFEDFVANGELNFNTETVTITLNSGVEFSFGSSEWCKLIVKNT